ncbi:hypothetical protein GOBAR_DD08806 [Gossypium barbadense]|nr:hypothetical protein GOBAR_DD08806 [Gossypium barbadense]
MDHSSTFAVDLICIMVAGVGGQSPSATPTKAPPVLTTHSTAPATAPMSKSKSLAPTIAPTASPPTFSLPDAAPSKSATILAPSKSSPASSPPTVALVSTPPAPILMSPPPAKSLLAVAPTTPPKSLASPPAPIAAPTIAEVLVPAPGKSKKKSKKHSAPAPSPDMLRPISEMLSSYTATFEIHCFIFYLGLGIWFLNLEVHVGSHSSDRPTLEPRVVVIKSSLKAYVNYPFCAYNVMSGSLFQHFFIAVIPDLLITAFVCMVWLLHVCMVLLNCLGALDGTHIKIKVPTVDKPKYQTRKGDIATNMLGVCTPEMQFVYVLPGWEGSVADGRRTRYHLNEWRQGYQPSSPQEFFNMKHASARNVIERCFGLLKVRWGILRSPSFYPVFHNHMLLLKLLEEPKENRFQKKMQPWFLAWWTCTMLEHLMLIPGSKPVKPNIESRIRLLKREWSIVYDMLNGQNNSGFGWDENRQLVVAEDAVWDSYLKLTAIYARDRATGKDAQTAVDVLEEINAEDVPTTDMNEERNTFYDCEADVSLDDMDISGMEPRGDRDQGGSSSSNKKKKKSDARDNMSS